LLYVDCVGNEDAALNEETIDFCRASLIGATYKEAFNCVACMLIDAHINNSNKVRAFDYGCSREMVWSDLYDFAREIDQDNEWRKNELIDLLPCDEGEEERYDDKGIKTNTKAAVLCDFLSFDDIPTLNLFYPHGWDDDLERIKNGNLAKNLAELEFVKNQQLDDQFEKCYCTDKDCVEVEEKKQQQKAKVTKPTKGNKSLYLMKCKHTGHYKIGVSGNPKHREKTLQSEKPTIDVVAAWGNAGHLEKQWHKHFAACRLRGEWFNLSNIQVKYMCSHMAKQANPQLLTELQPI